jgi:hypothetical protein
MQRQLATKIWCAPQYVNATRDTFHCDDLFENFIAVPGATATFHRSAGNSTPHCEFHCLGVKTSKARAVVRLPQLRQKD